MTNKNRPNCGSGNHRNKNGKLIKNGQCANCDEYVKYKCSRCDGTGTTYLGAPWAIEPGPCSCIYDDD